MITQTLAQHQPLCKAVRILKCQCCASKATGMHKRSLESEAVMHELATMSACSAMYTDAGHIPANGKDLHFTNEMQVSVPSQTWCRAQQ